MRSANASSANSRAVSGFGRFPVTPDATEGFRKTVMLLTWRGRRAANNCDRVHLACYILSGYLPKRMQRHQTRHASHYKMDHRKLCSINRNAQDLVSGYTKRVRSAVHDNTEQFVVNTVL